jgi:hypothetical protein
MLFPLSLLAISSWRRRPAYGGWHRDWESTRRRPWERSTMMAMRRRASERQGPCLLKLALPAFLVALLAAACGGGKSANLLANPGFEDGREPWYSMESSGWGEPFEVSGEVAHSGKYSAQLKLRPPSEPATHQVYGAVQSLEPETFPEFVSGFYRVENWQKETRFQYLQFVVIAIPPAEAGDPGNVQMRYILAGADAEPFRIDNAKFVFLDKDEPPIGEWVYFERNVRDDFLQLWGSVPEELGELRVFFEARYDSPTPIQPEMYGDVYYDDLYVGPEADAPTYE